MILADALTWAVDHKADRLVDLATLTGACCVALGLEVAGVMSNNDPWSGQVQAAARTAGELAWPLPMFPLYTDMIKSDVADMKNTGGSRYAGAISAAKFLEEFVAGVPWVHLDIAGPGLGGEGQRHPLGRRHGLFCPHPGRTGTKAPGDSLGGVCQAQKIPCIILLGGASCRFMIGHASQPGPGTPFI